MKIALSPGHNIRKQGAVCRLPDGTAISEFILGNMVINRILNIQREDSFKIYKFQRRAGLGYTREIEVLKDQLKANKIDLHISLHMDSYPPQVIKRTGVIIEKGSHYNSLARYFVAPLEFVSKKIKIMEVSKGDRGYLEVSNNPYVGMIFEQCFVQDVDTVVSILNNIDEYAKSLIRSLKKLSGVKDDS